MSDEKIKIGISGDPAARLRKLALSSPVELFLWALVPTENAESLEGRILGRLGKHKSHGEWFWAAPEVISSVDTLEDLAADRAELDALKRKCRKALSEPINGVWLEDDPEAQKARAALEV